MQCPPLLVHASPQSASGSPSAHTFAQYCIGGMYAKGTSLWSSLVAVGAARTVLVTLEDMSVIMQEHQ